MHVSWSKKHLIGRFCPILPLRVMNTQFLTALVILDLLGPLLYRFPDISVCDSLITLLIVQRSLDGSLKVVHVYMVLLLVMRVCMYVCIYV